MRILYLTDRLSLRGGAGQHLLQAIGAACRSCAQVSLAAGRRDADVTLPREARIVKLPGLATPVSSAARLGALDELLAGADVVHVQNVMNPLPLAAVTSSGRAIVTVQDHRVFCPGPGKTLPDGARCERQMGDEACAECLPDATYRHRMLELTAARREALRGARLVVLSHYMQEELAQAGLPGAEMLPPWVEVGASPVEPGRGFALAGRLVTHKAPLEAYAAWRAAEVDQPLLVAGEGPLETRLGGAELLGWLPSLELRATLRRARALLFPARWQEPFGILGLEALSEGTPVIVADSGGTADWSARGCLCYPPGDREALGGAIQRLADGADDAVRLGLEGRRSVAGRFDRSTLETRLLRLYEEVASRAGRASSMR